MPPVDSERRPPLVGGPVHMLIVVGLIVGASQSSADRIDPETHPPNHKNAQFPHEIGTRRSHGLEQEKVNFSDVGA